MASLSIKNIAQQQPDYQFCPRCPACELQVCRATSEGIGEPVQVHQLERVVRARSSFCHGEELSEFVPLICSGWAAVYVNFQNGSRQILSFVLPGEFVSPSFLLDKSHNGTVESLTEVRYRLFRRSDLRTLILSRKGSYETIMRAWMAEKRRLDGIVADLGRRSAGERIAGLIVRILERLRSSDNAELPVSIQFPLRQHHIADATGLTSVHVSKVLSEFRQNGILTIEGRLLSVRDLVALKRLAGR